VLWDLVDKPGSDYPVSIAESFDNIQDEDVTIFQIFDTELENDPADICHFIYGPLGWKSIFNREGDPRANAIDPILVNYNITCSGV
jgi:hypothetical protein